MSSAVATVSIGSKTLMAIRVTNETGPGRCRAGEAGEPPARVTVLPEDEQRPAPSRGRLFIVSPTT